MLLEGKKIFITGGYQGIGKACAKMCIAEGAKVTIMDFVEQEKLDALKEELGENCYVIHGDVTNSDTVNQCVAYAVEQMGGLTGAINNAGTSKPSPIMYMSDEDFDFTVKLCLYGTFYVNRAVAKYLKDTGGSIVNMSSLNSTIPNEGAVGYCAAKAGVDMITKTGAFEFGKYGIRVNAIRPGFTHTEAHDIMFTVDGYEKLVTKNIPLGRYGKPDDIANYAVFLLSDRSSQITGTNTLVDGGMEFMSYPDTSPVVAELMKRFQ